MIIACDVDDVVLDLKSEWLRRYNADYKDFLTDAGIHQWDMVPAVKKECGHKIYDYLRDDDLYRLVPPISFAQEAVAEMRAMGHRVVFVTSCTKNMADQKWDALERLGFLPQTNMQCADLVLAHDKSLINADVLIDDAAHNFSNWKRTGILFHKPHNASWSPPQHVVRVYNWPEILLLLHGDL